MRAASLTDHQVELSHEIARQVELVQRLRKIEALQLGAGDLAQELHLFLGFDPLGRDHDVQRVSERGDGAQDVASDGVLGRRGDERLVDLDLVEGELQQVGGWNSRCRSRPWRS